MKRTLILLSLIVVSLGLCLTVNAQRKAKLGAVCGHPTAPCKNKENFQKHDLPFDTGRNYVIVESQWFYGIVLKSKRIRDFGNCERPSFSERERLEIQALFPNNKVFMMNCWETGSNYYTGVGQDTALIGVFAGKTLAAANEFLKKVKETNRFPGVRVRRMQVGINGT
ncbi:MAG: hypothetical protein ABR530_10775 [Pyrinomonadaceae bacterium]